VIEQYELAGSDDEIVRRREEENESLRALAEFVNTRILQRAIERHADQGVLADATSIYAQLTDGNDAGKTAEIRERLTAVGVPVEELTENFVSHQTIRSHLNSCLDMETGRSQATDIEEVENLIEWARTRDEEIIDRAISRLRESGKLDIGETSVIHSVRVICEECGQSHRLQELLDAEGCECSDTATAV
jgi:DNA-binding transcriptional ArsR family regulator